LLFLLFCIIVNVSFVVPFIIILSILWIDQTDKSKPLRPFESLTDSVSKFIKLHQRVH